MDTDASNPPSPAASPPAAGGRDPDFTRFWTAQAVTQVGTQVGTLALPLIAALALDATPFQVGLLGAVATAPTLVLGMFAGVWVDRRRRRPVMVAADLLRFVVLLTIPLAAWQGWLGMGLLYAVAAFAGTMALLFDLCYVSYVPDLVGRDQLLRANSRLEASASGAQVIGPALGGALVGLLGAPFAMVVDALSFLLSGVLIATIRKPEPASMPGSESPQVLEEIRTGISFIRHDAVLRALALCSSFVNFFGFMFLSVYTLFMLRTLDLSTTEIGLVFAAGGVGALLGAFAAVPASGRLGVGRATVLGQAIFSITGLLVPLAMFVPSIALPLVIAAEFLQWFGNLIYIVNGISIRQGKTPSDLLGRVASGFRMATIGVQPAGLLVGGYLGGAIGLWQTLVVGEIGMALALGWLLVSPLMNRDFQVTLAAAPAADGG